MSTAAARAVPVASGPAAQPARLVLLIGLCSAGLVAALLLVASRVFELGG